MQVPARIILIRLPVMVGLSLLSVASGCGSRGPTSPQAQIHGVVTLDGSPVPIDTRVTFWSAEAGGGGSGVCDSTGKYVIAATDKERGVPAGRYRVTVMPKPPPEVKVGSNDYQKMMMSGGKVGSAEASATPAPPPSPIPLKYQDPEGSGLIFEVTPGVNDIPIKLAKGE